jgi:hypothetical protein
MRTRQTKKMYLARVKGRFPSAKLFDLPKLETLGRVGKAPPPDEEKEQEMEAKEEVVKCTSTTDAAHTQDAESQEGQDSKRMRVSATEAAAHAGEGGEINTGVPTKPGSPVQLSRKERKRQQKAKLDAVSSTKRAKNDGNRGDGEEESAFQGLVRIGYHMDGETDTIILRFPLRVVSYREGIHECNEEGKGLN